VLKDLAEHPTVESALRAEREITTVQPRFELDGDRLRFIR
jgi:hypothetical protein